MSEFSESYHLFSNNQEEGISLLRNAKIRGFVYPEENNWVTILPDGSIFEENKKLISQNHGILIHYIFAEDHGWSLSIFDRTIKTFHYECNWEEGVENNYQDINKSKIIDLVNRNPNRQNDITAFEISKFLDISDIQDIFELTPAYQMADLIGLKKYQWLSYDYMEMDKDDVLNPNNTNPNIVKGIIIVNN